MLKVEEPKLFRRPAKRCQTGSSRLKQKLREELAHSKMFVPDPYQSPTGHKFRESYDQAFNQKFVQNRKEKFKDEI